MSILICVKAHTREKPGISFIRLPKLPSLAGLTAKRLPSNGLTSLKSHCVCSGKNPQNQRQELSVGLAIANQDRISR